MTKEQLIEALNMKMEEISESIAYYLEDFDTNKTKIKRLGTQYNALKKVYDNLF